MDEHQTSQSNSSDADIHADDDLSNVSIKFKAENGKNY